MHSRSQNGFNYAIQLSHQFVYKILKATVREYASLQNRRYFFAFFRRVGASARRALSASARVPPVARDSYSALASRLPPLARKTQKITPVLQAMSTHYYSTVPFFLHFKMYQIPIHRNDVTIYLFFLQFLQNIL